MLTEEIHAAGVSTDREKVTSHEEAAHEKRNWVRLTYECNNRCVFCLDSDTHDGEIRDADEVKRQILEGKKKGASRLILSGGEPTIHPRFLDFVRLGRLAGYRRIQTVTNGRLFAYPEFLERALKAGLQEITFSLHGPNARIHDALVGVKGAFVQEVAGLKAALADGRPIVNVDIVINRGNIKVLPEMLAFYYGLGVREFDLLQVVPFGRAFKDGRDILFYDLHEAAPYIREALEFSERPDVHVWFNRFPPPHLEGYEELIQDPYKLNDEVRGRKEEFLRQLERGIPLDCREPDRCRYCYLEQLCDTLEESQRTQAEDRYARARIDAGWEASMPPIFGGDPASARRAREQASPEPAAPSNGALSERSGEKRRLPVLGGAAGAPDGRLPARSLREQLLAARPERIEVRAADLAEAEAALDGLEDEEGAPLGPELALDLASYEGLEQGLERGPGGDRLFGRRLALAVARDAAQAQALLSIEASFEVELLLTVESGPFALALPEAPSRLSLRQPRYERLTEARERDLDLPAFFAALRHRLPVRGVPACVLGRAPEPEPPALDASLQDPSGRIEIFRFTRRYILDRYMSKSLRCRGCAEDARCSGMHINQVRAHGFAWMRPIPRASVSEGSAVA